MTILVILYADYFVRRDPDKILQDYIHRTVRTDSDLRPTWSAECSNINHRPGPIKKRIHPSPVVYSP